eukprot:scaffold16656_cov42-Attheya_sp.AAC.1
MCGIKFQTESEVFLDLDPKSNGEYFSTSLCSMNSVVDLNGVIDRSGYNKCFEQPEEIHSCDCMPPPDPCKAMLFRPVLVWATIQNVTAVVDEGWPLDANGNPDDQAITNHYSVKIKKVYVNKKGTPNVVEGQTIEVRTAAASNRCGIKFQTESEMFLDLDPKSNGEYFSTGLCSMNSVVDSIGVIDRSGYNKCFDQTLRLKGQSDVTPVVVPKSVQQISPKLTKEERQAAKKIAKEAKQAANQAARKKTRAEKKALKKAQKKDVTTIWEACPRFKPNKKHQCNLPPSDICGYGKCLFGTFADKTMCKRKRQCICQYGYFKCKTLAK